MKRWIALALLLLLVYLQAGFWLGDRGWQAAGVLEASVVLQREDNARLKARNDALSAEVEDLKSGEAAVEERARAELGMVREGETFYRVVEAPSAAAGEVIDGAEDAPGDAP